MEIKKYIIATLALMALAALVFLNTPFKTQEYVMDVSVPANSRLIGVNTDTDGVHFGQVPHGTYGKRKILLENGATKAHVLLTTSGTLSEWVTVSDADFVLGAHANETIITYVRPPADAPYGNYTGTLKISFFRAI